MDDRVAEFFGYTILVIAVVLFAWEMRTSRQADEEVKWLRTATRFKRRMCMVGLLLLVGLLIIVEARGLLVLQRISHLVVYVTSLSLLAVSLFVLSIRDLGDMARNAERQALEDLQTALKEQQARGKETEAGRE